MKDRCYNCEHSDNCKIAYHYNFCEDCRDYWNCNIKSWSEDCLKGYEIECNNGFEDKDEEVLEDD